MAAFVSVIMFTVLVIVVLYIVSVVLQVAIRLFFLTCTHNKKAQLSLQQLTSHTMVIVLALAPAASTASQILPLSVHVPVGKDGDGAYTACK